MADFAFEIGSIVKLKLFQNMLHKSDRWSGRGFRESRGMVVERLLQECPGGVQRHYIVQWGMKDGNTLSEYTKHLEIELIQSEPFEPDPEPQDKSES